MSASAAPGERSDTVIDRRARTRRARGVESRIRGGRAALVRDADDEARRRRVERQLERLGGERLVARRVPGRPDLGCAHGLAQDLGDPVGGVLGRPAARHDDRVSSADRPADGARQLCRSAADRLVTREDPVRERRFGLDHVGHVEWRSGACARAVRSTPTGRGDRGAERSGRTRSYPCREHTGRAPPPAGIPADATIALSGDNGCDDTESDRRRRCRSG